MLDAIGKICNKQMNRKMPAKSRNQRGVSFSEAQKASVILLIMIPGISKGKFPDREGKNR